VAGARPEALDGALGPGSRASEQAFARTSFAADQTTLDWLRRDEPGPESSRFSADAQVFTTQEPTAG